MGAARLTVPASRDEYAARWAAVHGGVRPRPGSLIGRYLDGCYALTHGLVARGLRPLPVTAVALAAAVAVPVLCIPGGRWPLLAGAITLLAGLLDGLDGAVAVIGRRDSAFGGVLDSVADRLSDTAFALALWVLGAPVWLAGLVAGLAALQEYLRARAAAVGMREIGVITIWERPSRVFMTAGLAAGAGLITSAADVIATVGAAVSAAAAAIALGQLLIVVRRRLSGPG